MFETLSFSFRASWICLIRSDRVSSIGGKLWVGRLLSGSISVLSTYSWSWFEWGFLGNCSGIGGGGGGGTHADGNGGGEGILMAGLGLDLAVESGACCPWSLWCDISLPGNGGGGGTNFKGIGSGALLGEFRLGTAGGTEWKVFGAVTEGGGGTGTLAGVFLIGVEGLLDFCS